MNYSDFSRLNENIDSTNQISSAINSKEAQLIAQRSEEYITDHVLKVLNDPNYMNSSSQIDLRNVGFNIKFDYNGTVNKSTGQEEGLGRRIFHG